MITPTSSNDRTQRITSAGTPGQTAVRLPAPRQDKVLIDNAATLRMALSNQAEIRPDVVARARAVASDPDYPPTAVIRLIAQQILAAPDLSEDES